MLVPDNLELSRPGLKLELLCPERLHFLERSLRHSLCHFVRFEDHLMAALYLGLP